jgi:hypothetical protein
MRPPQSGFVQVGLWEVIAIAPESRADRSCEEYFLPASGARPEEKFAGWPSALAAEMRGGHQKHQLPQECKPFL